MISIIISSVSQTQLSSVEKNIKETIGVDFELIAIDNSKGEKGVCEIYNSCASLAKYDVLCFMHEDIKIHTSDWGKIIINTFKANNEVGLIGIAGSKYKSLAPSSWHCYDIGVPEAMHYQIIQNYKYTDKDKTNEYVNPTNSKLASVVCIDGVWMCCKRDAFNSYQFDQQMLKGFHGYDIDFSIGINQNYQVAVTFDVLIEHFSEGSFNKIWLQEILKIHKKWSSKLPINLTGIPQEKLLNGEKIAFNFIFKRMWSEGFKISELFSLIWNSVPSKVMTLKLFFKLQNKVSKYIFKKRLIS